MSSGLRFLLFNTEILLFQKQISESKISKRVRFKMRFLNSSDSQCIDSSPKEPTLIGVMNKRKDPGYEVEPVPKPTLLVKVKDFKTKRLGHHIRHTKYCIPNTVCISVWVANS